MMLRGKVEYIEIVKEQFRCMNEGEVNNVEECFYQRKKLVGVRKFDILSFDQNEVDEVDYDSPYFVDNRLNLISIGFINIFVGNFLMKNMLDKETERLFRNIFEDDLETITRTYFLANMNIDKTMNAIDVSLHAGTSLIHVNISQKMYEKPDSDFSYKF